MTVEDVELEKMKVLPPLRKNEVLDFVEFLEQKEYKRPRPRQILKGALQHLNIKFTDQDLREARNEIWRGYTKDTEDDK